MNLFAITAYAEDAAAAGSTGGLGGTLGMILPFVLIIAVMYFLMIRPQKKKEKLKQEMLSQLIPGDRILTIGGIHGKIVSIKGDDLYIETGKAPDFSVIKITRWAIGEVTKPGQEPAAQIEESEDSKEE